MEKLKKELGITKTNKLCQMKNHFNVEFAIINLKFKKAYANTC